MDVTQVVGQRIEVGLGYAGPIVLIVNARCGATAPLGVDRLARRPLRAGIQDTTVGLRQSLMWRRPRPSLTTLSTAPPAKTS